MIVSRAASHSARSGSRGSLVYEDGAAVDVRGVQDGFDTGQGLDGIDHGGNGGGVRSGIDHGGSCHTVDGDDRAIGGTQIRAEHQLGHVCLELPDLAARVGVAKDGGASGHGLLDATCLSLGVSPRVPWTRPATP